MNKIFIQFFNCFMYCYLTDFQAQYEKKFIKNKSPMNGNPVFFLMIGKLKKPKIKLNDSIIIIQDSATVFGKIDFSKPLTKISKYIWK